MCGSAEQEEGNIYHGPAVEILHQLLNGSRVVFIPSPAEPTPKYHRTEAERVVSILNYLKATYGERLTLDMVYVVTPWRTQIGLIRQLIGADDLLQSIHIDTIERFQGSENDIIIVSMAVCHPNQLNMLKSKGVFEYVDDDGMLPRVEVDRKMLVTLSRAKKQVVVLGDEGVIKLSSLYFPFSKQFLL